MIVSPDFKGKTVPSAAWRCGLCTEGSFRVAFISLNYPGVWNRIAEVGCFFQIAAAEQNYDGTCLIQMAEKKLQEKRDVVGLTMLVGLIMLIGVVGLGFTKVTKDIILIKSVFSCWLITALFLVLLATSLFKGEILIPRSKIMLPLGIYLSLALVSALLSRYRYDSFRELASLLCAVMLIFITLRAVANRKSFFVLLGTLTAVAGVSCVYGIAQHYGYDPVFGDQAALSEQGRVFSTLGHPNFFGSFLVLSLLAFLGLFFWIRSPGMRSLLLILICAVTLCLFYTGSRGAWLGLLGGLPVWFFLSVSGKRSRRILLGPVIVVAAAMIALILTEGTRRYVIPWVLPFWLLAVVAFRVFSIKRKPQPAREAVWGTLLLVAVVATSHVFLDRDEVAGRMESAFDTEKGSVLARKVIWTGALNMFKARPVFGWGLGTFNIHFPRFRDPATAARIMPNTLHAHSEYLEVATEMGVVGLAVFLWAIGAFLLEAFRTTVRLEEEWQRLAVAGLVAGCAAILLQAVVSVTTRWVVGRFFLWLGIGLTVALGKTRASQPSAGKAGHKGRRAPEQQEDFYRITMRPLRAPALRIGILLLIATIMVPAGWWGHRVLASSVLTRRGDGYLRGAEAASAESGTGAGIADVLNRARASRNEAIKLYERAIKLDPYNLSAYYKLGHCYNLQKRLEDSLRTYRRMARLAPDGSDIHFNLGIVYANMGRWESSKEELETALNMKVGPLTRLALARAYENLGQFAKAEGLYRALLTTDPDEVKAMNGLALLYLRADDKKKAIGWYERALAIEPEDADASLGMGLIHQTVGDSFRQRGSEEQASQHYAKAVEAIETALRGKPENVPIRSALALAYADVGRFQDALAQLREARTIEPGQALVYLNLGKVYLRMNEPQQAAGAFRQTISIDPKGPCGQEAMREAKQAGLELGREAVQ
jgi:tetratricopeptide (TPR) repeat protein/O-antigen ligase